MAAPTGDLTRTRRQFTNRVRRVHEQANLFFPASTSWRFASLMVYAYVRALDAAPLFQLIGNRRGSPGPA